MRLPYSLSTVPRDLAAGAVVFVVALPLCLGIALASGAPLLSGILAGVVGGVIVGFMSGSHTSVSGPAAGLVAIVAASISSLGFAGFLTAVVVAGAFQAALGLARAGVLVRFVPASVINGLLAAIGLLLVIKQLPHLMAFDAAPRATAEFAAASLAGAQPSIGEWLGRVHLGAASIGVLSALLLVMWEHSPLLRSLRLPAPLVVVAGGVGLGLLFRTWGESWQLPAACLVDVPVHGDLSAFIGGLQGPDFSQFDNPAVWATGLTIAVVASLETLLNLEAVDKLDPQQRSSPASYELIAQGVGNMAVGFLGGLPITSVVVRGTVNIQAGAQTRLSAIAHGVLLLVSVTLAPALLNFIPLSCLAAILVVTGLKLASPGLAKRMYRAGWSQFAPFLGTMAAILLTDLLFGLAVGLAVSVGFVLWSNLRRPIRRTLERHAGCDVVRIQLDDQVNFLNRASLLHTLDSIPAETHLLLDAAQSDYLDPEILDVIKGFLDEKAPMRNVSVSLRGFSGKHRLKDRVRYVDHASRDLQSTATPADVLEILLEGNRRFRSGERLTRDLGRQVELTAEGQHPLAVVVSCIDSRTPAELVFDLGIGDIFSVRIAGNVVTREVLGSVEYACVVSGAKLVLVMGHTRCGAVAATMRLAEETGVAALSSRCQHLEPIAEVIRRSIPTPCGGRQSFSSRADREAECDAVARENALLMAELLSAESESLRQLRDSGELAIHGAMYNVATGEVEVLPGVGGEPRSASRLCA